VVIFFFCFDIPNSCTLHIFVDFFQARAKLPKKRRRVIPVETLRPPHVTGPSGPLGPGNYAGTGTARRMNALKQNNPLKDIKSTPRMGT